MKIAKNHHKEGEQVEVKKILEKQLELLSERSEKCTDEVLPQISNAMVAIANMLLLLREL